MCSNSHKDRSIESVMQLWREASIQINSRFSAIKLNISTLDRLGHKGQNYFILHCRFVYFPLLYNFQGPPDRASWGTPLLIASCSSHIANEKKKKSSLLLGKPAEFILDNSDSNCVYLGNSDDLEKITNSVVVRNPEDKLPTLHHCGPVQKHAHQA